MTTLRIAYKDILRDALTLSIMNVGITLLSIIIVYTDGQRNASKMIVSITIVSIMRVSI